MRLSIENLRCSYQSQPVVDGFNLLVGDGADDGEIVCLFGKSGCGKSTVLKAVAGLVDVAAGRIQVNGLVVNDEHQFVAPEKRRVGMIFQDYALFPHLTVLENVAFSLPKSRRDEAHDLLQLVNLSEKSDSYPHQLSGGQQQRVAIARALAAKPEVLLMDEPFSNIDHQIRYDLIRDIRQILKKKRISTIFVTHNQAEAFAFADKIAMMRDGAVAQCDAVETVYKHPVDSDVGRLLGRLNVIPAAMLSAMADSRVLLGADAATTASDGRDLLIRPQFLSIETVGEGAHCDNLPEVDEVFISGDNSYVQVTVEAIRLLIEKSAVQDLNAGDRVVLRLLPHDYCFVMSGN